MGEHRHQALEGRTGALIHETTSALVVLGPEHAQVLAEAGWSKDDVRQAIYDRAVNSRADLVAVVGYHDDKPEPALVLAEGDFKDELLKVVSRSKIDLVVAGTRGRTGLRKMLLGSTTEDHR